MGLHDQDHWERSTEQLRIVFGAIDNCPPNDAELLQGIDIAREHVRRLHLLDDSIKKGESPREEGAIIKEFASDTNGPEQEKALARGMLRLFLSVRWSMEAAFRANSFIEIPGEHDLSGSHRIDEDQMTEERYNQLLLVEMQHLLAACEGDDSRLLHWMFMEILDNADAARVKHDDPIRNVLRAGTERSFGIEMDSLNYVRQVLTRRLRNGVDVREAADQNLVTQPWELVNK